MLERHIGDVGVVLLRRDPLVAEALQLIDKAGGIVHLTFIGSHLDGELVLVIAQREFGVDIQGLFEDHTAFVLLSYAHLLSEEFQTTEDGFLLVTHIRQELGVDDIDTSQTTYEHQTIMGTTDGTLVIGTVLQAVLAAETTDGERPLAGIVLLGNHVRDTMFRDHPHRVQVILGNTHDTGADKTRIHIEQRLMTCLLVNDTAA